MLQHEAVLSTLFRPFSFSNLPPAPHPYPSGLMCLLLWILLSPGTSSLSLLGKSLFILHAQHQMAGQFFWGWLDGPEIFYILWVFLRLRWCFFISVSLSSSSSCPTICYVFGSRNIEGIYGVCQWINEWMLLMNKWMNTHPWVDTNQCFND